MLFKLQDICIDMGFNLQRSEYTYQVRVTGTSLQVFFVATLKFTLIKTHDYVAQQCRCSRSGTLTLFQQAGCLYNVQVKITQLLQNCKTKSVVCDLPTVSFRLVDRDRRIEHPCSKFFLNFRLCSCLAISYSTFTAVSKKPLV